MKLCLSIRVILITAANDLVQTSVNSKCRHSLNDRHARKINVFFKFMLMLKSSPVLYTIIISTGCYMTSFSLIY